MAIFDIYCPNCSQGPALDRVVRICRYCEHMIHEMIKNASNSTICRISQLYTFITHIRSTLPNGGYEVDFKLVVDSKIRSTMQRHNVNFDDAVNIAHEAPNAKKHGHSFLSFHRLRYSEQYQIIYNSLCESHEKFLNRVKPLYHYGENAHDEGVVDDIRNVLKKYLFRLQRYTS